MISSAAASGIRSLLILSSMLCLKDEAPFLPSNRRMAAPSVVPRQEFENPPFTGESDFLPNNSHITNLTALKPTRFLFSRPTRAFASRTGIEAL